MKKVFTELTSDEFKTVELSFVEIEQDNWVLEKDENKYLLCGYFGDNFIDEWNILKSKIPALQSKILTETIIEQQDWQNEYKKYLHPIEVPPIHVVPIWEKLNYKIPVGEHGIYLDAGMAFGTGAHETTQLCLERLVRVSKSISDRTKKVIDVGCGSGILAIAAAKLGFLNVKAFDNDPDAISVSRENAQINHVNTINWSVDDIKSGLANVHGDYIMANILAPILIANADIFIDSINADGYLSLSGILITEKQSIIDVFSKSAQKKWKNFAVDSCNKGQWTEVCFSRQ